MKFMEKIKSILVKQIENMNNYWNVLFGQKQYKKFVIISTGRSGSNLLVKYLDSHKNIEAKGELFRIMGGESSTQRWRRIFNYKSKNILISGFKIFYYQPSDRNDAKVWDLIKDDKDIKIIHLIRENKVKSYVSLQIAEKTGIWKKNNKKQIPLSEKQVKIDFEDFIKVSDAIELYEENTRKEYRDHPFLEITYDELISDKNKVFQNLCSFLEVENQDLKSKLKKQNKEQLKDLVLNFDEFKNSVSNSKYSSFID